MSSSEELVEVERKRARNSERVREWERELEREQELERESESDLERESGRDLEREGGLENGMGLERGSDLDREVVGSGSSAGRMSPRAVTISEKVESIESGEFGVVCVPGVDRVVVALANAVALVLDLVVGVLTEDKMISR